MIGECRVKEKSRTVYAAFCFRYFFLDLGHRRNDGTLFIVGAGEEDLEIGEG